MAANNTKALVFTKKKIDDWEKTYSVNPLYLRIINANGDIEEKDWIIVKSKWIFDFWLYRLK